VTDKLYEATKREVMSEHEEYKNADVPKEVWIQRNEYLHKHIDNSQTKNVVCRSTWSPW
jgi:hypothetical protein